MVEYVRPQLEGDMKSGRWNGRFLTQSQIAEIASSESHQLQEDLCVGILGYVPFVASRKDFEEKRNEDIEEDHLDKIGL